MNDGVPRTLDPRTLDPRILDHRQSSSADRADTAGSSSAAGAGPAGAGEIVPMRGRNGRPVHRFPISDASNAFRRRFFPGATLGDWNDWRWQARSRIRGLGQLARVFDLSDDERAAVEHHSGSLPVGITPYYASLMSRTDPSEALRRTHLPVTGEYLRAPGEADDPLGEDHDTRVPGLVNSYPDRVLFLATGFCSTYCRYCTRSRLVGAAGDRKR